MRHKRTESLIRTCLFTVLVLGSGPLFGQDESRAAEALANQLHQAIRAGDEPALRALLDPKLLVFESGAAESSLDEYASHHMGADMAFMAAVEREVLERQVIPGMPLSVVSTRSRLHGQYRDQAVDLFSNETLVIRHDEKGARIVHIHWSSTDAR